MATRTTLTTPAGLLRYPHLTEPNRRFDASGVYETEIVIPAGDAADSFEERLQQAKQEALVFFKSKSGGKPVKMSDRFPAKRDDDGNLVVKTKIAATGESKDGRTWENRVAIFEPNINVVKWFFPALLVCENAHRAGHALEHVYVTNTNNEKMGRLNLKQVNRIVKSLDLTKQKRISIEARYNSLFFISKYADLAVSWQMENPLNYLYLDLAWMGWPIIHNAHLCKDVGYYYEGFNYAQGGQVLGDAMAVHDGDVTYMDRQRAMIERYLPTNKLLQKKYERLLEGVVGAQGSQSAAAPAPSTETQGPGA